MTIDGELQAIGAVARQMRARVPDARTASAWASTLETSIRGLRRTAGFLRSEANGQLPEIVGGPDGYEGLSLEDASTRFASRCAHLAVGGAKATLLLAEKQAFVAACASLAPPRRSRSRLPSPDASTAGQARSDGAATSKEAALAIMPKTGGQRRRVLEAVASVARDPRTAGLTDPEIQSMTGLGQNSERPRRVELVRGGWLEDSGQTREYGGSAHVVWVLTDRARDAAELWGGRASA